MSKKPIVSALYTKPETVLEDYSRLMKLAGYRNVISPERETLLKINISWQVFYPACSTTPWQLEGVIKTLLEDGFEREKLTAAHNRTVVVNDKVGEINNKHINVIRKYNIPKVHLYEDEWVTYAPKANMRVLYSIFDEIKIPKRFIGANIIHLPTAKTHVFTTMTGAMKNAFGGLLNERRHWTHSVIHETLVDLLAIQKEIHPGIFAVMDATFAGDGPGPRCMVPHVKNIILASADQVAIDAIAAKMMGYDPMKLDFIRLAHESGLGVGNPSEIEVVGDDISHENWCFVEGANTFASRGQKMIYHGIFKPFEKLLLRSFITPWSYVASRLYHDVYWYPLIGKKRVKEMMNTPWGKLFASY